MMIRLWKVDREHGKGQKSLFPIEAKRPGGVYRIPELRIIITRMPADILDPPIWKPSRRTRVELPGLCVMHGGPTGMYLPEHEHAEVQVQAQFKPASEGPGSPREETCRGSFG